MSRLFPEPMLYAVVGPEGALMFTDKGQALIFKNEKDAAVYTIGQIQGVKITEDKDF